MRALQAARKVVTVLVVEDDWIIREDSDGPPAGGMAVLEAATGVGALQALHEAEKVDLLITDIGLADADGLGYRGSVPNLAPRGAGDLCIRKPCKRSSPRRGECFSQQAAGRFRAYRGLPQASGAAKSVVIVMAP